MSFANPTVTRSMVDAAAAAGRLVERCAAHALTDLQNAEAGAAVDQRQQIGDAWRELNLRRKAWAQRFPALLGAAFQADAEGAARPQPAAAAGGAAARFMAFTLVDDREIARNIECSRLAQQLTSMLERPLAELDALMSSALGLDGIQPERNPLRPVVFAQALRSMMGEGDPAPAWPALWLRSMVKPLADGLGQLYREQAEFLTRAQVHAADYRVLRTPGKVTGAAGTEGTAATAATASAASTAGTHGAGVGAGGASGSASAGGGPGAAGQGAGAGATAARPIFTAGTQGAAGGGAPAPAGAPTASASNDAVARAPATEPPPHAVDAERLQQFLLRDEPQAHEPLAAGYYAQAEAELRALEARSDTGGYDAEAARRHMHLPVVDRPPRAVDTDSPLPPELWAEYGEARQRSLVRGRLKTEVREVGQVFGLEVVRRLLDQVAADPRLLAPLREAIVGLEPSLSRLAMVAPRFFGDEAHPGRLLVERVAERSFKYNDEFGPEFQAFFGAIAQTFQRLNQIERFKNAVPFQAALAGLQAEWAAEDGREKDAQRKVLEAVQFAERRQQEADRIAAGLRERDDLQDAPLAVQEFLLGTWALVLAQARLTQGESAKSADELTALVADLLWSVHRDLPLREPARAFTLIPRLLTRLREGLALLGQPPAECEAFFAQLEALHRPVLKLRAQHRHRDMAPPAPRPATAPALAAARPAEQPWMAEEDLRAAGFEDIAAPDAAPAGTESEDLLAGLAPGCWVDLHVRQQWRRARLVWTGGKGTLFMFVSDGGQPHSMTRRSLQRLLRDRLLRPVEADGVVPRALQKLVQPAAALPLAA